LTFVFLRAFVPFGETTVSGGRLIDPLSGRMLSGQKKRPDQFTLPAHCHARKPPEPWTVGNVGLCIEPAGKQLQLIRGYLSALNAIEQVLE
jgi:hypothetical protein